MLSHIHALNAKQVHFTQSQTTLDPSSRPLIQKAPRQYIAVSFVWNSARADRLLNMTGRAFGSYSSEIYTSIISQRSFTFQNIGLAF
jgi:hypothetical protein